MSDRDRYEWEIPDIQHFKYHKRHNQWKLRKENQTVEICSDCGQSFTREIHNQRRCPKCIAKSNMPKNHCACGRMLGRSPETVCSFCKKNESRMKAELTLAKSRCKIRKEPKIIIKCFKCGVEISAEDLKSFNGLCAECYIRKGKQKIWWTF